MTKEELTKQYEARLATIEANPMSNISEKKWLKDEYERSLRLLEPVTKEELDKVMERLPI